MSKFRNFKMVDYVVYGRGSFNQLGEILQPQRKAGQPMIFLVDHFFENETAASQALVSRIPAEGNDKIIFVNVSDEPNTKYVDKIAAELRKTYGMVSGVTGRKIEVAPIHPMHLRCRRIPRMVRIGEAHPAEPVRFAIEPVEPSDGPVWE